MRPRDFSSQGWKRNRDDWNETVQKLRVTALGEIEARRAWVPAELGAAWDRLAPLLDEIDFRGIPREASIWRKVCSEVQEMRNQALAVEELALANVLDELLASGVLFAQQALKDESPH